MSLCRIRGLLLSILQLVASSVVRLLILVCSSCRLPEPDRLRLLTRLSFAFSLLIDYLQLLLQFPILLFHFSFYRIRAAAGLRTK